MAATQRDRDERVLNYLHDADDGAGGAHIGRIRELVGEDAAFITCMSLRERGWLRDGSRSGDYHLTDEGRTEVERMRDRQADPRLRRRLCRDELLRWLDGTSVATRVSRAKFDAAPDGLSFSDKDSRAAAHHLKLNGLIESSPADDRYLMLWITDRGQECRDEGGDVAAFVAKDQAPSASQVFHISGSGINVAAAAGDNNQVTASLDKFDHDQAVQVAAAVREALESLPALDTDEVRDLIAAIQQREDLARAHWATATLHALLVGTTAGTLSHMLGTQLAGALGIG